MGFMERKEALRQGLAMYSTGKVCKNGHNTYRYASSGACSGCVNNTRNTLVAESHTQAAVDRSEMSAAVAQLIDVKIRVFYEDSAALVQMAEALCVARFPGLPPSLFAMRPSMTGSASGTAAYKLRIHPEDLAMVRRIAGAMMSARARTPAQIDAARAWAMGRAAELVDIPDDEVYSRDPR